MTFEPNPNRRKQVCPKCKSSSFTKTYFKKVLSSKENREIRLCPHCKSDRIKMTRTENKTKCHLCGGALTEPSSIIVYEFTVMRKKAYRRENEPRS